MNGNADVPNGPAATTIPMDSLITSRSFQTSQAVGNYGLAFALIVCIHTLTPNLLKA